MADQDGRPTSSRTPARWAAGRAPPPTRVLRPEQRGVGVLERVARPSHRRRRAAPRWSPIQSCTAAPTSRRARRDLGSRTSSATPRCPQQSCRRCSSGAAAASRRRHGIRRRPARTDGASSGARTSARVRGSPVAGAPARADDPHSTEGSGGLPALRGASTAATSRSAAASAGVHGRGLDHHPDQRLGAARPHQHASVVAELGLDRRDSSATAARRVERRCPRHGTLRSTCGSRVMAPSPARRAASRALHGVEQLEAGERGRHPWSRDRGR